MLMGTRCLGAPPLAPAIVTRNLPLARLSDSSGHRVQAKASQGHIRPPSVLILLSPFLHSLQVNEGWEGFPGERPQGGFAALQQRSCKLGQTRHPLPGGRSQGDRSAASCEEGHPGKGAAA